MFTSQKRLRTHHYKLRSSGEAVSGELKEKKRRIKKFDLVTRTCQLGGTTNKILLQFLDHQELACVARTSKSLRQSVTLETDQRFYNLLKQFAMHDDVLTCNNDGISFPSKANIRVITENYSESIATRIQRILQLIEPPLLSYLSHALLKIEISEIPLSIALLLRPNVDRGRFNATIVTQLNNIKSKLNNTLYEYAARLNRHTLNAEETVKKLFTKGANPNYVKVFGDNQPSESTFLITVKSGHLGVVKQFIAAGANVNYCGLHGADAFGFFRQMTVLMIAADGGFLEIVKTLVRAGADLNTRCFDGGHLAGRSALWYALRRSDSRYEEIAIYLIQAGAVLSHMPIYNNALSMAASNGSVTIVDLLLTHYRDHFKINQRGTFDKSTALMHAIENRYPDVVKRLLEAKANPKLQDEYGNTAVEAAQSFKESRIAGYTEDYHAGYESGDLDEQIEEIEAEYDGIIDLLENASSQSRKPRKNRL